MPYRRQKDISNIRTSAIRKKENAVVIGAGIIGLTTALKAQEAGYKVRIIADRPPLETTSAKAGAVFEPYQPGNMSSVDMLQFVEVGLREYGKIIDTYPEAKSGIRAHDLYSTSVTTIDPTTLPFLPAIPSWKFITQDIPGHGRYQSAVVLQDVPMIDPTKTLPFLTERFIRNGGTMQVPAPKILNMQEFLLSIPEKVVFNCTGLGAKELLGDPEIHPMRGQIVILNKTPDWEHSILGDDVFYIFPRMTTTVLGGTTELGESEETTTTEAVQRIIDGAQKIMDFDPVKDVATTYAALRPYRKTGVDVSLEYVHGKKHIKVIGFGGSGWTFNWGAAEKAIVLATE
ncbi:MAG TPA: FAD-dependent oxidoreductase [Candidatus Acidoferrales bacterium]|nr:FAD-dependent oxidoreductase [Candidatus Acidoferrales bacterium]